ncbi:lysozyme [Pararhizobium sp. BT-229]|uniref:lysozyme n=1 Tax=Pararhizobium sp. BT-229 TaxID=2986923 RepID=UPI0021F6CF38|nr:lysozyme [Pararhizobium sp. BT-229]MCV9960758.1 lysozyme [Pararhizobium sp. BT-229]
MERTLPAAPITRAFPAPPVLNGLAVAVANAHVIVPELNSEGSMFKPKIDFLSSFFAFVCTLSFVTGAVTTMAQEAIDDDLPSQSQVEDLGQGLGLLPANQVRPINAAALELIKDFEGWVPFAYDDPSKYCTIGYGHLIALKPCASITLEKRFSGRISLLEGEKLLEEDTRSARSSVQKLVKVNLNEDEFGALSAFTFNVGKANFGGSTLLKLLDLGERKKAAQQLNLWTKSKGKVLRGLVIRRSCERALFEGAKVLDDQGKFQRASCTSYGVAPLGSQLIDIDVGE